MTRSSLLDFAYQIVDLNARMSNLEVEVERLRAVEEKYNKLLSDTIKHSDAMTSSIVKMHCELSRKGG